MARLFLHWRRTELTEATRSTPQEETLPTRLPVIPVSGTVMFPHVVLPLAIGEQQPAAELLKESVAGHRRLVMLALKSGRRADEKDLTDPPFFNVGTLGVIVHVVELPDSGTRILVEGAGRVRVRRFSREEQGWVAEADLMKDEHGDAAQIEALQREIVRAYTDVLSLTPQSSPELRKLLEEMGDPSQLADIVSANLNLEMSEKQALLEEPSLPRRLEMLVKHLGDEKKVLEYGTDLQKKIRAESDKNQREYWLREQLKLIQQELEDDEESDVGHLRAQVEAAGMPQQAREQSDRELRRLERTPIQAPEYQIIRNYLDWLVSLPWSKKSEESIDLAHSREILDRDHYDLADIKQRIIEYLAVRKLNPDQHGPILCFVGPPGVGKTSLGRSIAESLGRRFVRISLGGMHDEAEIRGHRRTYVGALPGRIIQAMKQVGVCNPLVLLDEVDKIGQDFRGDPASALLEVLDPAQNYTFTDHYLEVPFDLSRAMFIATANSLTDVPPALFDRLEVLQLAGYTLSEKHEIANRYLIPRQRIEAGLSEASVTIDPAALRSVISEYTREAGVRELERQIARLMRKTALQVVEAGGDPAAQRVEINPENLADFAGKPRFDAELAGRDNEIGTATALAYTPVGGQILFVEAVSMPGTGQIRLTGQMGEVMRESAQAALSFVRSHAVSLHIPPERFDSKDVHVHVPAGATPKDGPSAGVALVLALASLFTGRAVKCDVAVTGEITLRGHVLAVGGVKEKLIAAAQAGIRTVLLPRRNEADLQEVPEEIRNTMDFILVDGVSQVLERALVERRSGGERKPPLMISAETNVA
jgi:ATP-dependent Lon protease